MVKVREDKHMSLEDMEENMLHNNEEEEYVEDDEEPQVATNTGSKRKKSGNKTKSTGIADKRGVCYLSRIPRHMDHVKLRQILSKYTKIDRIYLVPENPSTQMNRKRTGGYRGTHFSEGWVEFLKKNDAKWVARTLNCEQIGGNRKSAFYYDLWNIKYLRKFQWDDLTEEIAYKHAAREQKMALEISAAKRERDFYISKVEQSHALASMQERAKKKQKTEDTGSNDSDSDAKMSARKVIRHFPQNKPVAEKAAEKKKARLSKDILSGVFGRKSTASGIHDLSVRSH